MEFKQVYIPGLAHCSYVIGGRHECIVVDPARDVQQYLDIAAAFNLPITGIIETHLHADFVSGHLDLAKLTGARIFISKQSQAEYEHHGLDDGELITHDTLLIKMIDTPGHTPESSVFIVSDLERGPEPALIFSGDSLLIGDAGRPDLFPNIKEKLAADLYRSLRKIEVIGDHVEIYPAHGAGSLCGRSLSSKLSSTIGTERLYNPALSLHPQEHFIDVFLHDMPEAPDHFSRCSAINRKGPALLTELGHPVGYEPFEFLQLTELGYHVVDTRSPLPFSAAHVPGAYGLSLQGNFATFSGWVLPPDRPLLLVLESMDDLPRALRGLHSVGLDNVEGYLKGNMEAWSVIGLKTARLTSISIMELKELMDRDQIVLVDTRLKSEYDEAHIKGAIHAPAPDLRYRYEEWTEGKPVAFICNTGSRSLLAASLMLKYSGRRDIINVLGGTSAWINAGYPTVDGN